MVRKVEGRIIALAAIGLMFLGCSEVQEHTAPAIHDRDSVSVMTSYGVNTLISDSGVIKYKIVTERWDVNVVKNPSCWTFEKGVFFEQFDEKFHVQAYIQADTAWYFDQKKLWHLRGRVRIRNINGLVYESEELFWDGMTAEGARIPSRLRRNHRPGAHDLERNLPGGQGSRQRDPVRRLRPGRRRVGRQRRDRYHGGRTRHVRFGTYGHGFDHLR